MNDELQVFGRGSAAVYSFYPLSSCPRVPGEPASEVNSVLLMWAVVAALILGHLQGPPWAVEDLLDLP